jgi:hypothetical protein
LNKKSKSKNFWFLVISKTQRTCELRERTGKESWVLSSSFIPFDYEKNAKFYIRTQLSDFSENRHDNRLGFGAISETRTTLD